MSTPNVRKRRLLSKLIISFHHSHLTLSDLSYSHCLCYVVDTSDLPPDLFDYYDDGSKTFNLLKFFEDDEEYLKQSKLKRTRANEVDPKPTYTRNRGPRKDYRSSYWWSDYVVDEAGLYSDPNDRNGKTFRQRFGVDRCKVLI